jgi:hypothetical protein
MKRKDLSVNDLWQMIDQGLAGDQEKVDAAALAGKSRDPRHAPRLHRLLDDEDEQVRYYALSSLVLNLQQKDAAMEKRCWKLLQQDPDEDVRGMAAACLGSIYFGTLSARIFRQFLEELKSPEQPLRVKDTIYSTLFQIAGRPPLEWPGAQLPWKVFEESDIDWEKIAQLEDQMENP